MTGVQADHALVERILRETRVARELPAPGVGDYLGDLAAALARGLGSFLQRLWASTFGELAPLSWLLAVGLLFVLLVLLVLFGRHLIARRRLAPIRVAPRSVVVAEPEAAPIWDRERWTIELDSRLARSDPRAALEALWWWLARSVAGDRADRSWTSRELLSRSERGDLAALMVRLDRLAYGTDEPRLDDVRAVFGQLQRALA